MADAQPNDPTEQSPRERLERGKTLALRARRYWKGALLVFVIIAAGALVGAMQIQRVYASECVVLVKPAFKTDDQESPQDRAVRMTPKLRDTLLTRSRLEPLIKEFKLYPQVVDSHSMVDAVDEMTKHIGFKGRDSETFVISFEDSDAERARIITQRLAETTMDDFKRANMSSSQQQADFLSGELARSEQDLEQANRALASFLASHPEFASAGINSPFNPTGEKGGVPPGGVAGGAPPAPIPTSTDPQLASLYRQRARLEAELKAATQTPPPAPNQTITSLTRAVDEAAKRVAAAQGDLADKRTRLTDQHPDMVAAKAQAEAAVAALSNAEAQLDIAKKAQGGAPPSTVPTEMQDKLTDLNREIGARQSELAKAAATTTPAPTTAAASASALAAAAAAGADLEHPVVMLETEWARLLRAVGDARAGQEDLRRRSERARLKASATEAASAGQMEIIDPAYKPTHPKKGRRNAAIGGLAFALLAAAAYAASRVLMNDTLYDAADIAALNVIPILGIIPRLPPAPQGGPTNTAIEPHGSQGVSRVG